MLKIPQRISHKVRIISKVNTCLLLPGTSSAINPSNNECISRKLTAGWESFDMKGEYNLQTPTSVAILIQPLTSTSPYLRLSFIVFHTIKFLCPSERSEIALHSIDGRTFVLSEQQRAPSSLAGKRNFCHLEWLLVILSGLKNMRELFGSRFSLFRSIYLVDCNWLALEQWTYSFAGKLTSIVNSLICWKVP